MSSLPPGQIETRRFPVVGERRPLAGSGKWNLSIEGLVESPRTVDLAARFSGATVEGARFDGSWGLLEDQVFYLESQGVSLDSQ